MFAGAFSHADVITDWNNAALDAIRLDKTPPPKASRSLAMLHVATTRKRIVDTGALSTRRK